VKNGIVRSGKDQPGKPLPGGVDDKYTVLLLDEAQLDRLLKRPGLSSMGSRSTRTIDVWPSEIRRQTWLAGGIVLALLACVGFWMRGSSGARAAGTVDDLAPPVLTSASFSVTVGAFARDHDAEVLAERLDGFGLPSFTWRLDGSRRQVLVGPYVAIDEAERAQRTLASYGYRGTRLYVDERLRRDDGQGGRDFDPLKVSSLAADSPAVVLVAGPGRWSLVFEFDEEPRQVSAERLNESAFDVRIRPAAGAAEGSTQPRVWSVPQEVDLVRHVAVRAMGDGGPREVRARLTLTEAANAAVRTVGRRVYVDVSRRPAPAAEPSPVMPEAAPLVATTRPTESAPPALAAAARPAPQASRQAAPAATASAAPTAGPAGGRGSAADAASLETYRAAIEPVFARFEAIQPFLRSAVASPTPEVLAALGGTFGELEQTIQGVKPPKDALASRGLLISAVQLAKGAVAPNFTGDRVAQVREATAQFKAARQRAQN
jgi:cell division septation protein DedD